MSPKNHLSPSSESAKEFRMMSCEIKEKHNDSTHLPNTKASASATELDLAKLSTNQDYLFLVLLASISETEDLSQRFK